MHHLSWRGYPASRLRSFALLPFLGALVIASFWGGAAGPAFDIDVLGAVLRPPSGDGGGIAAVDLPAGGGIFEVVLTSGDIAVGVQDGAELFRRSAASLTGLEIRGSTDSDELVVILSRGNLVPVKDLEFHGGGGPGIDSLVLQGGTLTTVTYNFTNATDGSLKLDPDGPGGRPTSTITYTGLGPISSKVAADTVALNYSTASEAITIEQDPTDTTQTRVTSTAGQSVDFINPTGLLEVNGDAITLDSTISTTTGNITLTADSMDLGAGTFIDAGSKVVTLRPQTAGTSIDLGGPDATGILGLTDAELGRITAGTLRIGDANTGDVKISAPIDLIDAAPRVQITSGSAIIDDNDKGVDLRVHDLILFAETGIGAAGNLVLEINVTNLDIDNRASGGVLITDTAGGLTLTDLTGDGGSTINGTAQIQANSPLVINSDVTHTGSFTYTAAGSPGPGDDITIDGATITLDSMSNATLGFLAGDDILFTNGGKAVTTGGGTHIVQLVADTEADTPEDGGTVSQSGATTSVTTNLLEIRGPTGIGSQPTPFVIAASNLEGTASTGGIFVSNTGPGTLNIGGVNGTLGGVQVTGASGDVQLTNGGTVSIVNNGEIVTGPANVTVAANGPAADLRTGGDNFSPDASVQAGGNVSLTAGRDLLFGGTGHFGDVQGGSSIMLNAGRDIIVDEDTFVDAHGAAGAVTATAGGNISILATSIAGSRITTEGASISLNTGLGGIFTADGDNALGAVRTTQAGGNGPITISADDMDIPPFAGGPVINAGTNQVILQQATTTARPIHLGGSGSGSRLALTNDEVNEIVASFLQIGRVDNPGDITSTAPTTPSVSTLHLNSGGGVVDGNTSGNDITVGNLIVSAKNGIGIAGADTVLEINVTFLDPNNTNAFGVSITDPSGGLTIIDLNGSGGSTIKGGGQIESTNGPLTISNSITHTTGTFTYKAADSPATGNDLVITGNAAVQSTDAGLTFQAGDNFTLDPGTTIQANGTLTIQVDFVDPDPGSGSMVFFGGTLISDLSTIQVSGGADSDNFVFDNNGGGTNDGGTVDNIKSTISIAGGGGTNTATFDDSGDADGNTATVTSTGPAAGTIGAAAGDNFFGGGGGLTFNELSAVNMNMPANDTNPGDTVNLAPNPTTFFTINGNPPALPASPGDELNVDLSGTTNPALALSGPGSGQWSFGNRAGINYTAIETISTTNGQYDLVIDANDDPAPGDQADDGTADSFRLLRSGANLQVFVNNPAMPIFGGKISSINTVIVNGSSDSDTLTVDNTGGNPIPGNGVVYSGGSGAGSDSLVLQGGSFNTTTYSCDNAHDGSIQLDPDGPGGTPASIINYTGLDPVSSSVDAITVNLNYSTESETITVADSGMPGQTSVTSAGCEAVTFANPTGSLTINAGDTNSDTIEVNSFGSGFNAALTIDGQGGTDIVNVNAALNLGSSTSTGNLALFAETINLNNNLSVGSLTVNSNGTITLNGNILTDTAFSTGNVTFLSGGSIVLANDLLIDTEQGADGNAGSVDLGTSPVSAEGFFSLTINTAGMPASGNIDLGGALVLNQTLTLQGGSNSDATLANITVNDSTGDGLSAQDFHLLFLGTGSFTNNADDGIELANVTTVNLNNLTVDDNAGEGIQISSSGTVIFTSVTACGNDPGVQVSGAMSFSDTDGNFCNNDNHGIQLIDISGNVTLIRTTADDNDADADGTGDGINASDGGDPDQRAIGGDVLVQGVRLRRTTEIGQQENGAFFGGVSGNLTFEASGAQAVEVTGNSASGVVLNGASMATFKGGDYGFNGNWGVLLLPYVEADALYNSIVCEGASAHDNGNGGWRNVNAAPMRIFQCPADSNFGPGFSVEEASLEITGSSAGGNFGTGLHGINISGDATVTDSTFDGNGDFGLKLENVAGSLTATDVDASNNEGGGVSVTQVGGTMGWTGGNYAANAGPGLFIEMAGGPVTITNSTFENNNAAIDLRNGDTATIEDVTMTGNGSGVVATDYDRIEIERFKATTQAAVDLQFFLIGQLILRNSSTDGSGVGSLSGRDIREAIFSGNTFTNHAGPAVAFEQVDSVDLINNTATGNQAGLVIDTATTVSDTGGNYSSNSNHGIQFTDVSNPTLLRTTADNNGGSGIHVDSATTLNLSDMTLLDNTSGVGVEISNVTDVNFNATTSGAGTADVVEFFPSGPERFEHTRAGMPQQPITYSAVTNLGVFFLDGDDEAIVNSGTYTLSSLSLDGGTHTLSDSLTINATDNPDAIVIDGGNITINGSTPAAASFNHSNFESLNMNGLNGSDTISVQATGPGSFIQINGGADNDMIIVGSSANSLDGILGNVTVNGGGNDPSPTATQSVTSDGTTVSNTLPVGDTLNINDQGDPSASTHTLSATTFQRTGTALITYGTIETLNLNAGLGSDTINVTSTLASANTNINTSAGSDTVNLNATGASSNLTVNGEGGADTITVAGSGASSVTVVNGGAENDLLNLQASGSSSGIALNGEDGDDTFTIDGGGAGAGSVIKGSGGNDDDNFDVTPSTDASISIDGGPPSASDTLDYRGEGTVNSTGPGSGTISQAGFQDVTFTEIETVNTGPEIACPALAGGWMAYAEAFRGGVYVASGDLDGDGCKEVITGAGAGGPPTVKIFSGDGTLLEEFLAYAAGFGGGVRVAAADVDGDGRDEIITGAGPGGGPHVKVFDVDSPAVEKFGFMAYAPAFPGGVFVAAGDLVPTENAEIVTGADAGGGPHVKVFTGDSGAEITGFFAYDPAFTGGVRVAVVGRNSDPKLATGAGPGGGPHVKIYAATGPGAIFDETLSIMAYNPAFRGGVFVALGEVVPGSSGSELITGAGEGGGPHVKVFTANPGALLSEFMAYSPAFTGGVRVAAGDGNGDGNGEVITGPGPGGGPHVRQFE